MFRTLLASGSLLAVANAIAISTNKTVEGDFPYTPAVNLGLAQTAAQDGEGGSCCCHAMPCMPMCQQKCEPEIIEVVPEPMRDIILNLDVVLTHILHEQEIVQPAIVETITGNSSGLSQEEAEADLIQNVISPVVIQILQNDVLPAIPTCTLNGEPYPYPGADALQE